MTTPLKAYRELINNSKINLMKLLQTLQIQNKLKNSSLIIKGKTIKLNKKSTLNH